ncbi:uncharacterized protein LOC132195807 [Neocloeon triangulifer]|uniref:uncharacterized protein LOC132195807 n=1 Tax=Neocloeon triangulifer TaxID=2078957 RepID=UPI00286F158C|nr:uncharacterized protein LOC132195807 [Neocloeon triangulifer]
MEKETSFTTAVDAAPLEPSERPVSTAEATTVVERKTQQRVSKQSRPYVAFKFVETAFCVICVVAGRENWPAMLIRGNLHLALQPLIAGATFLVYCPLLLLSYALNRPPSPLLMACMSALGSVYFVFTSVTAGVFWTDLCWLLEQPEPPPILDLERLQQLLGAVGADPDPRLAADRLLLHCMLATPTAALFLADLMLTLKYAILRKNPRDAPTLPSAPLF